MPPIVPVGVTGFDLLWSHYPKRVAKKDAIKAWSQLNPDQTTINLMIAALQWQTQQESWKKNGGQYVPYLATWIRGERWLDEPPVVDLNVSEFEREREARHQRSLAQQLEYWARKRA